MLKSTICGRILVSTPLSQASYNEEEGRPAQVLDLAS